MFRVIRQIWKIQNVWIALTISKTFRVFYNTMFFHFHISTWDILWGPFIILGTPYPRDVGKVAVLKRMRGWEGWLCSCDVNWSWAPLAMYMSAALGSMNNTIFTIFSSISANPFKYTFWPWCSLYTAFCSDLRSSIYIWSDGKWLKCRLKTYTVPVASFLW